MKWPYAYIKFCVLDADGNELYEMKFDRRIDMYAYIEDNCIEHYWYVEVK